MEHPVSPKASLARPVNETSIPANLKCIACSKLLVNCFQSETGFRLCQNCVDSLHPTLLVLCPGTSDTDDEACNRMVSRATLLPDLATRREMSKLPVLCPNADCGCNVQLIWKNVDSHLICECDFEMSQCQLCSEYIVKKKFQNCHRNLLAADCCPNFYAHCSLCSDISMLLKRETISEHLTTTCPAQLTACKYASFGCTEVLPRSQLQCHYKRNNDEHLEQTVRQITAEIQETHQGLRARLDVAEADGISKDNKLKQMCSEIAQLMQEIELKELEYKSLQTRLESVEAETNSIRHENREKDQRFEGIQRLLYTLQTRIDVLEANKVNESSNVPVRLETVPLIKENSDRVTQEGIDASNHVNKAQQMPSINATSRHSRNRSLADYSLIATTSSDRVSARTSMIDAIRNRIQRVDNSARPREEAIFETDTVKMLQNQPASHRRSASDGSFLMSRDKRTKLVDQAELDNSYRHAVAKQLKSFE